MNLKRSLSATCQVIVSPESNARPKLWIQNANSPPTLNVVALEEGNFYVNRLHPNAVLPISTLAADSDEDEIVAVEQRQRRILGISLHARRWSWFPLRTRK